MSWATSRRTKGVLPELGTPIDTPWTCPEWCTVDHEADGYLRHGHVVHRKSTETSGGDVGFWYAPIGTWRAQPDEVVEVLMPFGSKHFTNGEDLRSYAAELVKIADDLDEMNAGATS